MAIVCDLCGGSSFVKEDDFFVCQGCGTKYSLEDAKKMMTTDISSSNKKDENAVLNYMTLGQNAVNAGNLPEAENYANKALETDSLNPDAWLLKGHAIGWQSSLENSRIDEAISYFSTAVNYASDENREGVIVTAYKDICAMLSAVINLRGENYAKSGGIHEGMNYVDGGYVGSGIIYNDGTAELLTKAIKEYLEKGNAFLNQHFLSDKPNNDIGLARLINQYVVQANGVASKESRMKADSWVNYCSAGIEVLEAAEQLNDTTDTMCQICKNEIAFIDLSLQNFPEGKSDSEMREKRRRVVGKLKNMDPNYQEESAPETTYKSTSSGGCYVATAVYGSYDCPQVWTLRRYRDYTLAKTWYGRAFIRFYYTVSPTLVKWFGDETWFKNLWKPTLDKMVAHLNETGVANTLYQDKEW